MRPLNPIAGYALSAAAHVGVLAWAVLLPPRAQRNERVDVEIVETVKPRPVAPKPPPPEPPKPTEPVKMRPARRVALNTPPPTTPPETPPPETPPPTPAPTVAPGPVKLGISLSSTSAGGGFAAPVGSMGGKPSGRAVAPAADDIGPVASAAALTVEPVEIDVQIPKSEYPKDALDNGFEGSVTLKILVDANGRVRRARILSDPGHGFGAAALKSALAHFRFKPGEVNGKPVAVEVNFKVTYEAP